MSDVKYDQHYRDDAAACGAPFAEFEAFCASAKIGAVLDLGCGQGRDALMFARAGHRVVGVDESSVGIGQLLKIAQAEGLAIEGIVEDICAYEPQASFDVVILDRVLHMLDVKARLPLLKKAMNAVSPGGALLIAEGPKGMEPVRELIEREGWALIKAKTNRLIARRPSKKIEELAPKQPRELPARTGGCLCGAVKYKISAEPLLSRICWCRTCQKISGNGTANVIFPSAAIEVSGTMSCFTSSADSGNQISRHFCPVCGTHLFASSSASPQLRVVRQGTMTDPSSIKPQINMWTSSAPSWACLDPTLKMAERQP